MLHSRNSRSSSGSSANRHAAGRRRGCSSIRASRQIEQVRHLSPSGGARYPPNVRGLKSSWFVMLALLPVALMTYSPWRSAYTSAASSAFRYATAP